MEALRTRWLFPSQFKLGDPPYHKGTPLRGSCSFSIFATSKGANENQQQLDPPYSIPPPNPASFFIKQPPPHLYPDLFVSIRLPRAIALAQGAGSAETSTPGAPEEARALLAACWAGSSDEFLIFWGHFLLRVGPEKAAKGGFPSD